MVKEAKNQVPGKEKKRLGLNWEFKYASDFFSGYLKSNLHFVQNIISAVIPEYTSLGKRTLLSSSVWITAIKIKDKSSITA